MATLLERMKNAPSTGRTLEDMSVVTSKDGTKIAYDKLGEGPVVIFITGVLCYRSRGLVADVAKALASHFTVYNYDRRGRGDSGDTKPYAVEREVEDIEALIDEAGGLAYLYGHSSGAALALEAALKLGNKVKKLAMYEPPYSADEQAQLEAEEFDKQLQALLAANRRGEAVEFLLAGFGFPAEMIADMRESSEWSTLEALAPTIAYDNALVGGTAPTERAANITVHTLVMCGGVSYAFMYDVARTLSQAIPQAQLRIFEDQGHDVSSEELIPVLVEFFVE